MQVLPANDDGTVHLGGDDGAGEDTAADGDETSEGALLVCADIVLASVLNPPRIAATSCPSLLFVGAPYRCKSPQWRSWAS